MNAQVLSKMPSVKSIPSSWLERGGRRLDCNPYMSGGLEAKVLLDELKASKEPLTELTTGHDGGIYNGPQFERDFVLEPRYGVPFLGTSSMLRADLAHLPFLNRRDAHSTKLSYLRIAPRTILISCSGTVGRMTFARPDMDGMWSNQDILKVVADDAKIQAGYLYAYLRSKFGVPLVLAGTYGAIIQHIEPRHIADLPVPRLGKSLEGRVAQLVEESSKLLAKYQSAVNAATSRLFECVGLEDITATDWHLMGRDTAFAVPKPTTDSIRALNFTPRYQRLLTRVRKAPHRALGAICVPGTLRSGGRFKRIDAAPQYSYRLVGQKEIFWVRPEGRWIAKNTVGETVLVPRGTVMIAAQGTLGESELYCRAEFIWGKAEEYAYSQHFVRAIADEAVMPRGCLFAFLRSETAFRMLRSISIGTKLQDLHPKFRAELPVPYPAYADQQEIHDLVAGAYASRDEAVALEETAIALVEDAIENGATT